jgi:hypothetical protein
MKPKGSEIMPIAEGEENTAIQAEGYMCKREAAARL